MITCMWLTERELENSFLYSLGSEVVLIISTHTSLARTSLMGMQRVGRPSAEITILWKRDYKFVWTCSHLWHQGDERVGCLRFRFERACSSWSREDLRKQGLKQQRTKAKEEWEAWV